jgi:hypothetical protein
VLENLRATRSEGGILGDFRIDRNGDIVPATVPIFRVTGRSPPRAGVFPYLEGAVVDRVLTVPAELDR